MRLIAAALMAAFAQVICAQPFPAKPVRLVVPYPPGGTTDNLARALQEPMGRLLGQPFVVENRPGAGGALGTREVARAVPDGHTLVFGNNGPNAILPVLKQDLGYDALKSFAPVAMVAAVPLIVVAHGGVPAGNLREFIEYARREPKGVDYGSAGAGGLGHMATELFARATGIRMVHIPYSGGGPASASVLAGDTKLFLSTFTQATKAQADAGRLKILGVTSPQATALVPGVPPVADALPGFAVEAWFGILAPSGTPPALISRLNDAVASVLMQTEMQERFRALGANATTMKPAQFGDMLATEFSRWQTLVRETGLRIE